MRLSNRDSISKIKIKWKLIHLSLLVYLMHNALESHMKLIPGFPACSDVGPLIVAQFLKNFNLHFHNKISPQIIILVDSH